METTGDWCHGDMECHDVVILTLSPTLVIIPISTSSEYLSPRLRIHLSVKSIWIYPGHMIDGPGYNYLATAGGSSSCLEIN